MVRILEEGNAGRFGMAGELGEGEQKPCVCVRSCLDTTQEASAGSGAKMAHHTAAASLVDEMTQRFI